jgi:type II secretory pathway pseudopilin PulG
MVEYNIQKNKGANGFTLVETLIVLGIGILMMFALIQFFLSFNSTFSYMTKSIDVASDASRIMNEISSSIMTSKQVLSSYTFSGVNYQSSSTALVLELPSIDSSGTIIVSTYDHIAFYTTASSTYKLTAAAVTSSRKSSLIDLSDQVQSLTFTYDNGTFSSVTKVDTDVVTKRTYANRSAQTHLHEQVRLRNK